MHYLVMYITGHVHLRHSSIALRGHMRGMHPWLEDDERLALASQPSRYRAMQGACDVTRTRSSAGTTLVTVCACVRVLCECVWTLACERH